jgi:phosphatidylserine decarboxylase
MTDSFAAAHSTTGDVRRQGGWLPGNQDELEAWLAGHRERVAAKGEQVPLHPALAEFQALIDSDPVVRMYFNEMIAQVPRTGNTASGTWKACGRCCGWSTKC